MRRAPWAEPVICRLSFTASSTCQQRGIPKSPSVSSGQASMASVFGRVVIIGEIPAFGKWNRDTGCSSESNDIP